MITHTRVFALLLVEAPAIGAERKIVGLTTIIRGKKVIHFTKFLAEIISIDRYIVLFSLTHFSFCLSYPRLHNQLLQLRIPQVESCRFKVKLALNVFIILIESQHACIHGFKTFWLLKHPNIFKPVLYFLNYFVGRYDFLWGLLSFSLARQRLQILWHLIALFLVKLCDELFLN